MLTVRHSIVRLGRSSAASWLIVASPAVLNTSAAATTTTVVVVGRIRAVRVRLACG